MANLDMAYISLINFNYNIPISYNNEIFIFLWFIIIVTLLVIVTKCNIKNKETSPQRIIRLQKQRDKYKINKLLKIKETITIDDKRKEKQKNEFGNRNQKRKHNDNISDNLTPKRTKTDSDLIEMITPKNINSNKIYPNESIEHRTRRLNLKKHNYNIHINKETPEQAEVRIMNKRKSNNNYRNLAKEFDQSVLIDKFNSEIYDLIDKTCVICHRKFYKEGVSNFRINEKINIQLNKIGYDFLRDTSIITCHSCKSSLNSNKLPAMSYLNNLNPGDVPDQLKKLNPIELSCISRVKPYMKIMKMNNVFGQSTFKGLYGNFNFNKFILNY